MRQFNIFLSQQGPYDFEQRRDFGAGVFVGQVARVRGRSRRDSQRDRARLSNLRYQSES